MVPLRMKLMAFLLALASLPALASLSPDRLRCEYLDNPLGIDTPQPRLSWVLESKQRAEKQTAYQILAASSEALLKSDTGDLWDTGKVASDQTAAGGLCRQGARLLPALLLESARVGQGRQGLRLQPPGLLGNGSALPAGLAGPMDCPHHGHRLLARAPAPPRVHAGWQDQASPRLHLRARLL